MSELKFWFGIFIIVSLITLFNGLIISCKDAAKTSNPEIVPEKLIEPVIKIVIIDGCEYFDSPAYGYDKHVYTHKGNCKNHK